MITGWLFKKRITALFLLIGKTAIDASENYCIQNLLPNHINIHEREGKEWRNKRKTQ